MSDDWGLYDRDHDASPICRECESDLDWVVCDVCDGSGFSGHDCGEDCCACIDPEDNEVCAECMGVGGWLTCPNPRCGVPMEVA